MTHRDFSILRVHPASIVQQRVSAFALRHRPPTAAVSAAHTHFRKDSVLTPSSLVTELIYLPVDFANLIASRLDSSEYRDTPITTPPCQISRSDS